LLSNPVEDCPVRPRSLAALGLFALLQVANCTSRTTPLPPPVVNSVRSPDADGRVSLAGLALEGASIGVLNERTHLGVIATSSTADCDSACPFEATIAALSGDTLWVWQFFEAEGAQEVPVPQ
jgi:hypothetical protein